MVMQVPGGSEVGPGDVQCAADLAAYFSKARGERRAPVIVASPSDLKRPKGARPGQVKLTLRHLPRLNIVVLQSEDRSRFHDSIVLAVMTMTMRDVRDAHGLLQSRHALFGDASAPLARAWLSC